jgi:head-tail adaptor
MTTAFARFMVHSVDLLAPTYTSNRYGDAVADWTVPPATTVTVKGWFTRLETEEEAQGREAITDTYEFSTDLTVPITDDMRIVRNGQSYEIRGSVDVTGTPDGDHHQVVRLRRVVG